MNCFRMIRRIAVISAGLAGALLAFFAAAVPAAFASVAAPLGGDPHGRPRLTGAQTGPLDWQIVLIASGTALLAIAVAVSIYRMRAARRRVTVSAA